MRLVYVHLARFFFLSIQGLLRREALSSAEKGSINLTPASRDLIQSLGLITALDFELEALLEESHEVLRVLKILHWHLE